MPLAGTIPYKIRIFVARNGNLLKHLTWKYLSLAEPQ